MKFAFSIAFLLIISFGFGQSYTDSLKSELEGASRSKKVELHREISMAFYNQDPVQFLEHAEKSTKLAVLENNKWAEAYTLRLMGIYYDGIGEYSTAQTLIDSAFAINLRIKDKGGVDACISSLGIIYYHQGKYADALEKYQQVVKLYEESGELEKQAQFIGNIGGIYSALGKSEIGLEYYAEALKLSRQSGDAQSIATSLSNYGGLLYELNRFEEALPFMEESLERKLKLNNRSSLVYSYRNLSSVYEKLGQHEKSQEYLQKAIDIDTELGNKDGLANSLFNLATKQKKNDTVAAIETFRECYNMANQVGNLELLHKSAYQLGLLYYYDGQYKYATDFIYMYAKIRDSIFQTDQINALSEMEAKYQTEKKQKEIALLNKDNELKSSQLQMSREAQLRKAKEVELLNKEKEMSDILLAKTKMENEAKAKENELLKMDQDMKEAKLKMAKAEQAKSAAEAEKLAEQNRKQSFQLLGAIIGFLLIGILAIVVFRGYRQKKKANSELEAKNIAISSQKSEIELQKDIIEEKSKDITDSIVYAKRIQEAILPPPKLLVNSLPEHFLLYKPKDIVAGDFYWLENVNDTVIFAAADCTGHGVPGAMVSVVCCNAMNRSVREFGLTDPGQILDKTRAIVEDQFGQGEEEVKDGMDISLCALKGNTLHFAGANNPLWIIRKGGEEIEEYKATKQAVGKVDNPVPFVTNMVELNQGDSFYVFSDGFADQFGGEKGKKFKSSNFKKLLLSAKDDSMASQKELIEESFENWRGDLEQLDDVCVIGVRV